MSDDLIPISEKASIAGSPAEVWSLISDPTAVVACVPGASISVHRPDGAYDATIAVKFGPTVARFSGEVAVDYDHAARHCTVEGRGIDQRGASHALVSLRVTIDDNNPVALSVDGGFKVAGPLETFASAGGVHVARALLGEFARNMAALVESRRPGSQPTGSTNPAPSAELQGGRLLWNALVSWLCQLLGRVTLQRTRPPRGPGP